MKPDPQEPAELLRLLRQQLILAQARIMEVEDERDQRAAQVAELETLLATAQQLADAQVDEAAHQRNVAAAAQSHATALQAQLAQAAAEIAAGRDQLARATAAADHDRAAATQTIAALEAKIAAMESTRSWRWTAWLR